MAARYVKLSSKNQLTLPRSVVRHFPGTRYFEIAQRENEVVLRPARIAVQGETLSACAKKSGASASLRTLFPRR